ncbi:serine O-acetyltransferase [Arenibacter amylolyticus]|uniref:serine O-acetyltransferase n=1 Tax=Arenibacter amylolyticus TaxID=1406873 RepID=UPI000A38181E|nr:DapH/DapD/GlmU-related protein [Arenibacter amylolyticus]
MILTIFIQVVYGVDIDYKCDIEGGVIIIHGVGTVIGSGAKNSRGTKVYHQVTLGIKGSGIQDGFPTIGQNVVLGAGSKLLGNIIVGDNSIIGANVVLTRDLKKIP